MTEDIVSFLKASGYDIEDLAERVHLSIEMVQSYAHECVYDKHDYIDYEKMRSLIIDMILDLYIK